ncbi:hypothetical protein AR457_33690 [Streptomyces agglomeratus]|uniref:Uncharacterized protein n=1 Tax=Streptomyces agglomeratus TaxID=285458 RepID=A0A1E5PGL8_9ACTN|nr:hypothetical protein [Streptomyces agglomeratus]OEJ28667.1 hypothetical protein AS594_33545 [Streptomyces agglomeratus]OEJ36143.1 hypothetical protein AR457_35680 [Streptomyces agglomeratus]OEJ37264.1 hypothetical protein BGK70_02985 [Streptomyces agglomeratus]OEJ48357.1 hypothetical protein AR457_33690 [Streptomyces agglomeratus]OEJ49812.1 hypothetical protein BGK72_02515 [Streptomyces agglomeratus]
MDEPYDAVARASTFLAVGSSAKVSHTVIASSCLWRAISGVHLVPLVRGGARFENGVLVEREEQAA